MKFSTKYFYLSLISILIFSIESCKNSDKSETTSNDSISENSNSESSSEEMQTDDGTQSDEGAELSDSEAEITLPPGYVLFDKIDGDLNGDGATDRILIVKDTKKENFVDDEYQGLLDRNRRGLLIYFNNNGKFDLIVKNLSCFSSENEDGGVYFPPDLSFEITNGKLYVHYGHGRYGYWKYTFRYKNADFELIGYDSSENYGPIVNRETSINFLTKKKFVKENVNQDAEENGDEIFVEKWENINVEKIIKLSQIKDFDGLEME